MPSSGNFRNDYHRDIPTAPIDSTEKMKFQLFPLSRFSFYLSISFLAPCLSLSSLLKGKLLNSDDAGRGRLGDEGGGGEGEGVGRNRRGGAYLKDRQMAQVNASAQRSMRSLLFKWSRRIGLIDPSVDNQTQETLIIYLFMFCNIYSYNFPLYTFMYINCIISENERERQ